jgi:hypothetical protein
MFKNIPVVPDIDAIDTKAFQSIEGYKPSQTILTNFSFDTDGITADFVVGSVL